MDETITKPPRDVHGWFGLSYSNYLVIEHRAYAAMPATWHQQFIAVMDEYRRATEHVKKPTRYLALAGEECTISDLSEQDMRELEITCSSDEAGDPDDEKGFYYQGEEYGWYDRITVPTQKETDIDVRPIVYPRTLLQSMPLDWQHRFVALMEQADEVARRLDVPTTYVVRPQQRVSRDVYVDIDDPVPHYNRGRTQLELAAA